MTKAHGLLSLFACAFAVLANATAAPPLKLVKTFRLPADIHGHFDHLAIDLKHSRLFATPEDYGAVLVLNPQTGEMIQTVRGIGKPHAVFYRDDRDRIYVTDGKDGDLKIYSGTDYQLQQSVKLLKDADSKGYDPSTQYLFVENGGGDVGSDTSMLTYIDTTSDSKVNDLAIPGKTLEAMSLDEYRPRLYLNNKARNEVTVVDRWRNAIVASWPITLGHENVAMALDEPHQRLFVACRSGQLVIFDTNTGAELKAFPIVKGVDDLVFDRSSKRLYASGDGAVSVYHENDADHFESLGDVASGPLGRTALLVPELSRYFVAVPQHGSEPASILVFETTGIAPTVPVTAQIAYKVRAPFAEALVRQELSAHPNLRKMGLHAIAPGQQDSVIIANGNATRIGIKTTAGDFAAVGSGKTYSKKIEDGSFFNMKMPMFDAQGRRVGLLVMEIPETAVTDEAAAIAMAESIRKEMEAKIPDLASLFGAPGLARLGRVSSVN